MSITVTRRERKITGDQLDDEEERLVGKCLSKGVPIDPSSEWSTESVIDGSPSYCVTRVSVAAFERRSAALADRSPSNRIGATLPYGSRRPILSGQSRRDSS